MFPLSTPTNSGLGIDLLSLAIVFAGLAAFVVGLADLWTRVRAKTGRAALPDLDPVTLAAYAALGLVGLAVALMLAGVPGIPVAQAVFLAIAAWGVAAAAGRASRVWEWLQSASGADLARAALFAVAVGGVIAWGLLRWNGADVLPRTVEAFSWADLGRRLLRGWNTLFDHNYGMDGIKAWLIVAGLLLLVLRRRALGVSWRVVAFLACVVLVAAVALAARVLSLPGFDLIAGAYYDEPARTVEVLYEAVGFCLIGLAWSVWSLVRGRADHVPLHPRRGRTASAIATVLVVGAVGYQQARTAWVYDHIGFWDRKFKTPRISRLQAVGAWIQQNTEQNAIIFHLPFDAEVWEAWTGRRGSFMYSECYAHNDRRPCIARRELVNGRIDVLRHAFDEPAAAERCLTEIDRFGQPGYFLVRAPVASTRSSPVCSDAVYVTSLDSHAIFRYRRP